MFDTMTMTKVTGAVCGSLLVYLFAAWGAESLYHVGHGGGHGEGEEIAQAYSIDTGAEEASAETAEAGPDFATVFASADAAAGEKVFAKCKSCHKLDGADATGPHLNGIVNKNKGTSAGYAYSEALAALTADVWSPENLNGFLENPKGYMPGTKMSFAGLPKVEDRANLIAYLATTTP
ncbi:MAG: cytochrome C [Rhodobacter sp. CACIA14H1]|nr:MAG: cytochrome C [Rhodobacter sp. CACIA14H1]